MTREHLGRVTGPVSLSSSIFQVMSAPGGSSCDAGVTMGRVSRGTRIQRGIRDGARALSRYVGKWWELRELRENDRVPLIWAESMVRELRDGDTPLYPSSRLY